MQAKPCSPSEQRSVVVWRANSRIDLLVRKAGMLISFNNGLPHLMHDISIAAESRGHGNLARSSLGNI